MDRLRLRVHSRDSADHCWKRTKLLTSSNPVKHTFAGVRERHDGGKYEEFGCPYLQDLSGKAGANHFAELLMKRERKTSTWNSDQLYLAGDQQAISRYGCVIRLSQPHF